MNHSDAPSRANNQQQHDNIIAALKTVFDPELPVNLYDLGLIYELEITPAAEDNAGDGDSVGDDRGDGEQIAHKQHDVHIKMTLTTPNCPVAEQMPASVQRAVQDVEGVRKVTVELVWEPAWSSEMMTEDARLELEFRGISWKDPKASLGGPMGGASLTIGRKNVGEKPKKRG